MDLNVFSKELNKLKNKISKNPKTIDRIMSKIVGMITKSTINGFTKRDKFVAYNLSNTSHAYMHQYGIDFGFGDSTNPNSYRNRQWIEHKNSKNEQGLDGNILKGYIRHLQTKVNVLKHETV